MIVWESSRRGEEEEEEREGGREGGREEISLSWVSWQGCFNCHGDCYNQIVGTIVRYNLITILVHCKHTHTLPRVSVSALLCTACPWEKGDKDGGGRTERPIINRKGIPGIECLVTA